MRKNKVDVITLGCSKNLVDSEQLIRQFLANGYKVQHNSPTVNGEIVVLNTCGFIGDAQEESINMILSMVEAKKQGRIGQVYVMGCLTERFMDELKAEIPEVDGYCAIPLITGKHQSRPMEELVAEAESLVASGVKEIQLIAQDLTFYGLDRYKKNSLAELMQRLSDVKGLEWLRLHYAYPADFPREILSVMRERENICNYLDIALQHISDPMLQQMRRRVTKAETYELLGYMRESVPGLHLRTTLMTGHPGETEQDFEELLQFVRDIRFDRMGAFVYSHETGTFAYDKYEDDIPLAVKQERMDRLMSTQEEIATELNAAKVGKTFKVLIDRAEDEYYIGRTEYDSPEVDQEVLINKEAELTVGNFYPIEITSADIFDLYGQFKA